MSREMKATHFVKHLKLFLALIVVSTLLGVLIPAVRTSGIAQSNSEREFEDKIPKHLPIKIKIQPEKEKAAKDLNNRRWHHDLAFEVKNTGDKPIYYLYFVLDMPEITDNGISLTFIVRYGQRSIFGEWKGIAQPKDKPIQPNETVILKIPESQANGWDNTTAIEMRPQPKKLSILFQELNFGDGTGFYGTDGKPTRPVSKSEQSRAVHPAQLICNPRRQKNFDAVGKGSMM